MKKVFLAASLIIAATSFSVTNRANASIVSFANKSEDGKHIPASKVPPPVIESFNYNFPTATNTTWEKEKEHGQTVYQADFLLNGKRWRAEFAPDGTLLSSGRH